MVRKVIVTTMKEFNERRKKDKERIWRGDIRPNNTWTWYDRRGRKSPITDAHIFISKNARTSLIYVDVPQTTQGRLYRYKSREY